MFAKRLLAVLVPAVFPVLIATSAHAGVALIGIGQISGSDLSGQTYALENGAAVNLLGGMGSSIAWAGGDTFLMTPDRGPNASAWNAAVDDTTSWISRFQTVNLGIGSATFTRHGRKRNKASCISMIMAMVIGRTSTRHTSQRKMSG